MARAPNLYLRDRKLRKATLSEAASGVATSTAQATILYIYQELKSKIQIMALDGRIA